MDRKVSDEGLEFIKDKEGVALEVYLDPVGIPTVGVGHVLTREERKIWKVGMKADQEQVVDWLREDVRKAEDGVNSWVTVALSQEGFDALVSFVFNVGVDAFKRSTLLKRINQGRILDAAAEFERWVFSKNRKLPGLVTRRSEEKNLFLKGEMAD
jgi:lysozyme